MKYVPIKEWNDRHRFYNGKYILVHCPEHPKSFLAPGVGAGYYYEHRLFWEARLGRILKSWESVHHISEDRADNSLDNTFLCTRKEHDYAQ